MAQFGGNLICAQFSRNNFFCSNLDKTELKDLDDINFFAVLREVMQFLAAQLLLDNFF